MTEPKTKPKKKKITRAVHRAMSIEVAVDLSPEAEMLIRGKNTELNRIADILEETRDIHELRLRDAVRYTAMIRHVIEGDQSSPPTGEGVLARTPAIGDVVDDPYNDPLGYRQEAAERQILAEEELNDADDPVFGPDDLYDPTDDTFATGKECPNCESENIRRSALGDPEKPRAFCEDCHHEWLPEAL